MAVDHLGVLKGWIFNYGRVEGVDMWLWPLESSARLCVSVIAVLWHCWLGGRKGIRPVKNMGDGGGGHWLVLMEWRLAGWTVCLPLLISPCTIKSRSSLLAPAHPGSPRKRTVKRFWWCNRRESSLHIATIISYHKMPVVISFFFIQFACSFQLLKCRPSCVIDLLQHPSPALSRLEQRFLFHLQLQQKCETNSHLMGSFPGLRG